MIYAKVLDGIVVDIANTNNDFFVFKYKRRFKIFSLWLRVDELEQVPEIGWKYDKVDGFTEN